jgi:hypothetical protein
MHELTSKRAQILVLLFQLLSSSFEQNWNETRGLLDGLVNGHHYDLLECDIV